VYDDDILMLLIVVAQWSVTRQLIPDDCLCYFSPIVDNACLFHLSVLQSLRQEIKRLAGSAIETSAWT